MKGLLKILFPSIRGREFLLLLLHTGFLISRTFISIQVANMDGALVRTIVQKRPTDFLMNLSKWLLMAIPASYVNSMIRYLEKKLAIALRTRLVEHLYQLYMNGETYYRVENLDSRLKNSDQSLTQDVASFCDALAHIHSQISKPLLDLILMSIQLIAITRARNTGANRNNTGNQAIFGVAISFASVWMTANLLKWLSPPFGKLTAQEAELEGKLRAAHSSLITNAEEIAFYQGHNVERTFLWECYLSLIKHMNTTFKVRIWYNMLESFLMKYVWSATGLLMVAVPTFTRIEETAKDGDTSSVVSERTEAFVTSRNLLLSLSDACERIMSSYKEVTALAGYTHRVSAMVKVFKDLGAGRKYKKEMARNANVQLMSSRGEVTEGDFINFEDVPIVSPNGDVLIESLSFTLQPGMHTLISGPNGCGKSSLFRILSGLWPVYKGKLTKPHKDDLYYIPQKPYMSHGTLRDQVIYPDTKDLMESSGKTDKDLEMVMDWVNLMAIVKREGGWDAKNDWADVLSGGEKQRLAMARLFYHRPKFAILDECTSAVSEDVEGKMYLKAKELNITLLTVTHRHTLWKYHNYLLQMDGSGGWKFTQLDISVRMTLKEEKSKIEHQLIGLPMQKERLRELCLLLGENSKVLEELDEKQVYN
uniref:ABC transporter domain-containing protein n=1 Tax=Arcella intermedia TaxID=1963864 RepID=A0A6B2KZG8_9EUKA